MSAFLYHPPAEITLLMRELLSDAKPWNIHMQGTVGALPIQADVAQRESGEQLLRVSYAPLKRINNQWVFLDNQDASGGLDLFESIILQNRLSPVKEQGREFARYSFAVTPSTLALFPDVVSGKGEVWFPQRPRSWIPDRLTLVMTTKSDLDVKLDLRLRYTDLFGENYPAPANPRPLAEVLAKLSDTDNKISQPSALAPLAGGGSFAQTFSSDFDQDGLSDALELFYGTDSANPDSDNDTFADGEEVSRGYNPAGAGTLN